MTNQEFKLIAKYVATTDPEMFDSLVAHYKTKSLTAIGKLIYSIIPETAESLLEDAKAGA